MKETNIKRYYGLNFLRTIACIGILMMHVKANVDYKIDGEWINRIIDEFTNFVFLFMIISSFSICCGYYEKIKNNLISPEEFYLKRLKKILPFFGALLILDIIVSHNIPTLIEAFANSTLMFNFLQKDIECLGVAWFLGLVFVFYYIFPFFTVLFSNKKRAWFITIIAMLMNIAGKYYFEVARTSMFYSFIFFCIGGLLYLYKDKIVKMFSGKIIINMLLTICSIIAYFSFDNNMFFELLTICLSVSLIINALSFSNSKVFNNKITSMMSSISFEIYLSHMVIFRIAEKLKLTHIFENNYVSYSVLCIIVLFGAIIFAKTFQYVYKKIESRFIKNENIISK